MKTKIKLLFFLASLVLVGLNAQAQCFSGFIPVVGSGGNVQFYNFPSYDSLPGTTLTWDFGDGSTGYDSIPGFTHTYAAGGNYIVCLNVTNSSAGWNCTTCDTIQVNLCYNLSAFYLTQTGFGDYTYTAYNAGSSSLNWDFGDGTTSTLTSPTHHYATSNSYTVQLIANNGTCADTSTYSFGMDLCRYYSGGFAYDSIPNGPVRNFTTLTPHAGYTYSWNFGDGTSTTGNTVTHSYATGGNYTVCLLVSDATTGCTDSTCENQYFDRCGLGWPSAYVSSNGVNVDLNSYLANSANGISPTYQWEIPGASPSTASTQNVSVTYPSLGTYSTCVLISNAGCTDTVCTSFTLTAPIYNIAGTVRASGSGACVNVYLIKQDSIGHLVLVDSIITSDTLGNCNGIYQFNNVPVDTYYVKAAVVSGDPNYASYLPTYFGDVLHWANATPVYIVNSGQVGVDINLIAGSNPGGPGFVGGYISQGAGLVLGGGSNHGARSAGDPLKHVQVNLLTSTDQPVGYTYTDVDGNYHFSNLALGSYKIYAEVISKAADPIPFTLTAQNPVDSSINMAINSSTATGIEDVNNITVNRVFPNPVVSGLEVQVNSAKAVNATLKLIDVLGRTAFEQNTKLNSGENTLHVEMQDMTAGVYTLEIQTDAKQLTYKIVKTK